MTPSEPPVQLPQDQTEALAAAASQIATLKGLLPENLVTRSDSTTSHHIGQDYILRLRHAGANAGLTSSLQLWLGGVIGAFPGGVSALISYFSAASKQAPLPLSDLVNIIALVFFAAAAFAVWRQKDGRENVDKICDEIESRKKTKAS